MADWGYTYLQDDRDVLWFDEGLRYGYELPPPASSFKRCWGIRHLRAFLIEWRAYHDYDHGEWQVLWQRQWVAYAVKKGWV